MDVDFKDDEVITFTGWIHTCGYVKRRPQTIIQQINCYVQEHNHSDNVRTGFVKAALEYQKRYPVQNY